MQHQHASAGSSHEPSTTGSAPKILSHGFSLLSAQSTTSKSESEDGNLRTFVGFGRQTTDGGKRAKKRPLE